MKIVRVVVSLLLVIGIVCSAALCLAMAPTYYLLSDTDALAKKICDKEYLQIARDEVASNVEHQSMLMSLDSETFIEIINWDDVDKLSSDYVNWLIAKVITDAEEDRPSYESEQLKEAISQKLVQYASENELELEEGSEDTVYELISATISSSVVAVADSYVNHIHIANKLTYLKYWYAPLIVSIVFLCVLVLINRKRVFRALLWSSGAVYIASFSCHIVAVLLLQKGYMSNVALSASLLRELLIRLYNISLGTIMGPAGILATAALVVLLISIVACSIPKKSKNADTDDIKNDDDDSDENVEEDADATMESDVEPDIEEPNELENEQVSKESEE